jgi:hypothetical protein
MSSQEDAKAEAERCERICKQQGVSLRAYQNDTANRGDREKLRQQNTEVGA